VAEIAWKAAILNPHLGADAAKKTPGIVLIDEVDLHLHPRWQHRVLRDLRTTFPEMQFIVTTHSPQIISTAEAGWLRILDGGEEPRLVEHVQGWDSNAVLEQIMGAHHRPPETQEKLNALFTAIAEEDFPKAKALLDQLERQMGHQETELVHARLTMQDLPMDADHEKNPEVP
jgi:predicted ATP-binding protein involved in virulence